jgi:hypothetical protein
MITSLYVATGKDIAVADKEISRGDGAVHSLG